MSERTVINLAGKSVNLSMALLGNFYPHKTAEAGRVYRVTAVKMKSYSFFHPALQRRIMLILTHQCSVIIILFGLAK